MSLLVIAELEDRVARLEQPTELRAALKWSRLPSIQLRVELTETFALAEFSRHQLEKSRGDIPSSIKKLSKLFTKSMGKKLHVLAIGVQMQLSPTYIVLRLRSPHHGEKASVQTTHIPSHYFPFNSIRDIVLVRMCMDCLDFSEPFLIKVRHRR